METVEEQCNRSSQGPDKVHNPVHKPDVTIESGMFKCELVEMNCFVVMTLALVDGPNRGEGGLPTERNVSDVDVDDASKECIL